MQVFCRQMLNSKLGIFLSASSEAYNIFEEFNFKPGRSFHTWKGTLINMYRTYSAHIPNPQWEVPADHPMIIGSTQKDFRPDDTPPIADSSSGHPPVPVPKSFAQRRPIPPIFMLPPPVPPPKPNAQGPNQKKPPTKSNAKRKNTHEAIQEDRFNVSPGQALLDR